MSTAMQIIGWAVCVPSAVVIVAMCIGWAYEQVFKLLKINRLLVRMIFYPTQRKLAAVVVGLEGAHERCIELQSQLNRYQRAIVRLARSGPTPEAQELAKACGDYPDDGEWAPLAKALGMESKS
jgi:hypothetical protein